MSLHNYLNLFHRQLKKLEDYGFSESTEIKEEIRAKKLTVITAHIVLFNGSSLHIHEYIDARYKIERKSYAYHYQDNQGKCIFRYDNADHKPALGFKEHRHSKDGIVIEAALPVISDLIEEVIKYL